MWFGFSKLREYAYNKAFKRDLARVAFLFCVEFCVLRRYAETLCCVPAPLNAALVYQSDLHPNLKCRVKN